MTSRHALDEAFTDELAAVVDGDEEALERWADHLADHEEARDLVYESRQLTKTMVDAGADYVPPADVKQRFLATIAARDAAAPEGVSPTERPSTERPSTERSTAAEQRSPDKQPLAATGSRRRLFAIGGVCAGLAAAAAVALSISFGGEAEPNVAVDEGLSATLAVVARSAGEPADGSGVSVAALGSSEASASEGQSVSAGSTIRTDSRTRARLQLSDGSTLVLNQGSQIVLGEAERSVELVSGELLADVAHLEDGPNAQFQTPAGRVEVLGTKLVVTASADHTSVRVTRGSVRVFSTAGASAKVQSGQEALLATGTPPVVVAAVDLASTLSWSELEGLPDDGDAIRGLGELRAKRPGEREETERPLALARHSVKVRIVGNIARTEVEEEFRNDDDVELEGIYRFPMPPDARIASLALEVDGVWELGAFVDKERGARIWRGVIRNATPERQRRRQEEFIWVPGPWRDPALLEWQQGGRVELRIFPIPANGARRVRIVYEQNVAPHGRGRRYVYPLAHAADDSTNVDRFDVDVRVAGGSTSAEGHGYAFDQTVEDGAQRLRYAADRFAPNGDLIVDYHSTDDQSELRYWSYRGAATSAPPEHSREQGREDDGDALREQGRLHDDERPYALFALRPELPGWTEAQQRDYVLVIDSSQSMTGERYRRARDLAAAAVAEMDRRDRVMAVACDFDCQAMETGPQVPSSVTAGLVMEFLDKVEPAGSSDLSLSLERAVRAARRLGAGQERQLHVVYIGDGASTVGAQRPAALGEDVRERLGGVALSTVGIGHEADTVALATMARAGGGHYVPFVPGQNTAAAALALLESTYGPSLVAASLQMPDGVEDVAPLRLPTIRMGQEVLVAARLSREQIDGELVLTGKVGGERFEQRYPVRMRASTAAGNAFVPRTWASNTIDSLELAGSGERAKIVALSKAFGVMSRQTSLIVLESEAMFQAFGVDRPTGSLLWTGEEEAEVSEADGTMRSSMRSSGPVLASRLVAGGRRRGRGIGGGGGIASPRSVASMSSFSAGSVTPSRPRPTEDRRSNAPGTLRIQSQPSSQVFVDGRRVGNTPQTNLRLEAGRHRVTLVDPGTGARENLVVSIRPGQTTTRMVRLQAPNEAAAANQQAAPVVPVPPTTTRPTPRGGRWARKVWYRAGQIDRSDDIRERDLEAAREAEAALREQPDSRDRHRAAVRALSRAAELERAEAVARAWLQRDPLDAEALTYLSDVVGRNGSRDEALRLLSGIVDLQPDNEAFHQRLAAAFDRAGLAELACGHRVRLAELESSDEQVANALRCERARGDAAADRVLQLSSEDDRDDVRALAERDATPERVRGDLVLDATWTGDADIDISLITPQGTRLSWLGGRRHVVGADATGRTSERLGLRRATPGTYYLEINRAQAASGESIEGRLRIHAFDERQTIPFQLSGDRAVVGRVSVVRRFRIE